MGRTRVPDLAAKTEDGREEGRRGRSLDRRDVGGRLPPHLRRLALHLLASRSSRSRPDESRDASTVGLIVLHLFQEVTMPIGIRILGLAMLILAALGVRFAPKT